MSAVFVLRSSPRLRFWAILYQVEAGTPVLELEPRLFSEAEARAKAEGMMARGEAIYAIVVPR